MSGAWDAMLLSEERANDPAWAYEEWKLRKQYGYGRVGRESFAAGVAWVLARQGEWEGLTEREAIRELRKGEASIFYPLFRHDPKIFAECPLDGRVTVGVEGYCDRCSFEFDR